MEPIRVLLADDHTLVRQGLRALLQPEEDIAVVGEAETGREALQLAKKLLPNVVVMDIAMPMLNGREATRQITREIPSIKILILSAYNEGEWVQELIEAGAAGYLLKHTVSADLIKAIRETQRGNAYFSPAISRCILEQCRGGFHAGARASNRKSLLSPRETEVLRLIAEGASNKQIAADLFISIKTVEKHRYQMMDKLNIHHTAGLTRYAISKGVIECQPGLRAG